MIVTSVELVIAELVELVAVTVAVTVSAVPSLHESVDVPPRLTFVGFILQLAVPVAVTERFTEPVSPFRDATLMMDVARLLTFVVRLTGFAMMLIPGPVPA